MNLFSKNHSLVIYMILLFIVPILLLHPLFSETVSAEDLAPPTLSINTPEPSATLNTGSVTISGTVSDDVSPQETIIMEITKSDNTFSDTFSPISVTGTAYNWSYQVNDLINGDYTFYIKATDEAGNISSESITFAVNLNRPFVLPNVFPALDQTHVPLDTSIRITLNDDHLIKIMNVTDPIFVSSADGTTVLGSSNFDSTNQVVTFTPITTLASNKKYFVSLNPEITDNAGNKIFPRQWSFTTGSVPEMENPHGNYTHNVNTCVNCHGTHFSKGPKLENGKYTKPNTDNYCMACHDGTAAPMPENMDKAHQHNFNVDPELTTKSGTCTSCHNPHLTWSDSNPNMLKDHWTYDHPNSTKETHDTMDILCEECHDRVTTLKKDAAGVQYNVFPYRKSTTASGLKGDFALCLRCHDGTKTTTNISQFYETDVPSGHKITAVDGSPLNGQIPCAECHDTHGSNNIKILKEKLGHENQMNFPETSGVWDSAKERTFCTKCHNGNTAIYGVTARFTETTAGHEVSSLEACSKCHGGASQSFLEAAHAPKKAVPPVETTGTTESTTDPVSGTTTESTTGTGTTTDSTIDSGTDTTVDSTSGSGTDTTTSP